MNNVQFDHVRWFSKAVAEGESVVPHFFDFGKESNGFVVNALQTAADETKNVEQLAQVLAAIGLTGQVAARLSDGDVARLDDKTRLLLARMTGGNANSAVLNDLCKQMQLLGEPPAKRQRLTDDLPVGTNVKIDVDGTILNGYVASANCVVIVVDVWNEEEEGKWGPRSTDNTMTFVKREGVWRELLGNGTAKLIFKI